MKIGKHQNCRFQAGFTLLEVLVAIVLLSLGLLGYAGLQMASIKNSASAYQRSQATMLSYDIIDRMRVNSLQALAGNYDTTIGASPGAGTTVAAQDLADWKTRVSNTLPGGDAAITVNANGNVLVTIRWVDKRDQSVASSTPLSFNTQSVIVRPAP